MHPDSRDDLDIAFTPTITSLIQEKPRKMGWALWQLHRFCGFQAQNEGQFMIPTVDIMSYGRVIAANLVVG